MEKRGGVELGRPCWEKRQERDVKGKMCMKGCHTKKRNIVKVYRQKEKFAGRSVEP